MTTARKTVLMLIQRPDYCFKIDLKNCEPSFTHLQSHRAHVTNCTVLLRCIETDRETLRFNKHSAYSEVFTDHQQLAVLQHTHLLLTTPEWIPEWDSPAANARNRNTQRVIKTLRLWSYCEPYVSFSAQPLKWKQTELIATLRLTLGKTVN